MMLHEIERRKAPLFFAFEGLPVRVMVDDHGMPWWVGVDVCNALGLGNSRDALGRLDDDERGVGIADTLGGPQEITTISEGGLYSLILRSRVEGAKRFKRWVTHEVLPSIRKSGSYGTASAPDLSDPTTLRGLLLGYSEKVLALEATVAAVAPKAEALDRIATRAEGSMCITDAAKALQVAPGALFELLQARKWIYRRAGGRGWIAYQCRIAQGFLTHRITTVHRADGTEKVAEQVLVTARGLTRLAEVLTQVLA